MKKSLLIIVLMALLAPTAMNAQGLHRIKGLAPDQEIRLKNNLHTITPSNRDAQTLTVSDGTATNANVPIPCASVGNGIFTQFVVPADSLVSLVPDGYYANITGLTFYSNRRSVSFGNAEFVVMIHDGIEWSSSNPGFFYPYTSNGYLTGVVYYGSLSVSDREMSIEFNQVDGFEYYGGNLVISIMEYTNGSSATGSWYGNTLTNAAAYHNGTNGYLANFLPKTTFTYTSEEATCVAPGDLAVDNITKTTADLTWTERGQSEAWEVIYCSATDTLGIVVEQTPACTLEGLTEGTDYDVYICAICDPDNDEYSDFAYPISFTTHATCEQPTEVKVSNLTSSSANLSWTGYDDTGYDVRYRVYAEHDTDNFTQVGDDVTTTGDFVEYEFNLSAYEGQTGYIAIRHYNCYNMFWLDMNSIYVEAANGDAVLDINFAQTGIPEGWHNIDLDGDGFKWNVASGSFVYSESYSNTSGILYPDNWLVSPMITLGGTVYVSAKGQDSNYAEEVFGLFVSTTELVENEWILTEGVTTNPYTIQNLQMGETYEAQVKATTCSNGEWSESVYFTTPNNLFMRDGSWNDSFNWESNVVPEKGANVTIAANAIIPEDFIANAGKVTIIEGGSLTIEDGGQLIHSNTGVVATMEKKISGYTGEKDNYYLIASPVVNQRYTASGYYLTLPNEVENMLSGEYDLYGFDCTQELEWRNYKVNPQGFAMWQGKGYLYANSAETTTLRFTGELHPFADDFANNTALLTYEASDENFTGFNLVGNIFATGGYIVIADYDEVEGITGLAQDVYFYTIKGDKFVASTGAVAPMQGVMVQASSDSQVALCFTEPIRANKSLNLNLSNGNDLIDAAYISFNEVRELSKLQLNPNHTKLFFSKDNKDYAVVYSEGTGEMPVNFKAEKNGTYTLSFSNENVDFGYLHLIDNMTGADIDLLQTPSYTFDAKVTDYASRFKIVFNANNVNENNSNDSFAFYNNGNIIVNGNGTLNIVDMLGRRVLTQELTTANCQLSTSNFPAGVYMLQLVNGDNVKTQKVVVK